MFGLGCPFFENSHSLLRLQSHCWRLQLLGEGRWYAAGTGGDGHSNHSRRIKLWQESQGDTVTLRYSMRSIRIPMIILDIWILSARPWTPLNAALDVMILVCYACPKSGPLQCQLYTTALPEAPLNYLEPKQKWYYITKHILIFKWDNKQQRHSRTTKFGEGADLGCTMRL